MDLASLRQSIRQKPGMYLGPTGPGAFTNILNIVLGVDSLVTVPGVQGSVLVVIKTLAKRPSLRVRFEGFRLRESGRFPPGDLGRLFNFSYAIGASSSSRLDIWQRGKLQRTLFDTRNRITTAKRPHRAGAGVEITLHPFPEFTQPSHESHCQMAAALDDFALLHPGSATELVSDFWPAPVAYYYPQGLESWLFQNDHRRWPLQAGCLRFAGKIGGMSVEGALRMLHAGVPQVKSFVNGWPSFGGAHHEGLGDALKDLFPDPRKGCRAARFITNPNSGAYVDLPHSFLGVLSLRTDAPRYEGPTRDVLLGDEIRAFVREAASATLQQQWEELHARRI